MCFRDEILLLHRNDYLFTEGAGAKVDNALVFEISAKNRYRTV